MTDPAEPEARPPWCPAGLRVLTARLPQFALVVSTLGFCWLGMQVVHELGHILTAHACGETIGRVVLHPLTVSRTEVSRDRCPLLVVWGGPLFGSALPLVLLAVARSLRCDLFYLFQFFAGFCLIANGVYLGVGSFGGVGDAGDLLRHGGPQWTLIGFGLVCAPLGLWLWNGLGRYFGLGESEGRVDRRAVRWSIGLVLTIVAVEVLFASR